MARQQPREQRARPSSLDIKQQLDVLSPQKRPPFYMRARDNTAPPARSTTRTPERKDDGACRRHEKQHNALRTRDPATNDSSPSPGNPTTPYRRSSGHAHIAPTTTTTHQLDNHPNHSTTAHPSQLFRVTRSHLPGAEKRRVKGAPSNSLFFGMPHEFPLPRDVRNVGGRVAKAR